MIRKWNIPLANQHKFLRSQLSVLSTTDAHAVVCLVLRPPTTHSHSHIRRRAQMTERHLVFSGLESVQNRLAMCRWYSAQVPAFCDCYVTLFAIPTIRCMRKAANRLIGVYPCLNFVSMSHTRKQRNHPQLPNFIRLEQVSVEQQVTHIWNGIPRYQYDQRSSEDQNAVMVQGRRDAGFEVTFCRPGGGHCLKCRTLANPLSAVPFHLTISNLDSGRAISIISKSTSTGLQHVQVSFPLFPPASNS